MTTRKEVLPDILMWAHRFNILLLAGLFWGPSFLWSSRVYAEKSYFNVEKKIFFASDVAKIFKASQKLTCFYKKSLVTTHFEKIFLRSSRELETDVALRGEFMRFLRFFVPLFKESRSHEINAQGCSGILLNHWDKAMIYLETKMRNRFFIKSDFDDQVLQSFHNYVNTFTHISITSYL